MDPLLSNVEVTWDSYDLLYAQLRKAVKWSDERLAGYDIGQTNLLCASGLPKAARLSDCFDQLVEWTRRVRDFTERNEHKFHKNPAYYEHSFAKYQMMAIATEIHHNQGISYYLPADTGDYDGTDSRNLFIHGILTKHGGTCCNMPVLQIAIGRRLGYPLYLRKAHRHYYARWDEPSGESFNIECTVGFAAPPDEFYRQGRMECTDEEVKKGCYLRNLTPREELAQFLLERHNCLKDHRRLGEAYQALYFAYQLFPDNGIIADHLRISPYLSHVLERARVEQGIEDHDLAQVDLRKVRLPEPQEEWERPLILDAKDNIERMARNEGKRAKLKGGIEEMLAVVNKRSSDQLFGSLGRFDAIPPANNGNGNGNNHKENGHAATNHRKVPRTRRPK